MPGLHQTLTDDVICLEAARGTGGGNEALRWWAMGPAVAISRDFVGRWGGRAGGGGGVRFRVVVARGFVDYRKAAIGPPEDIAMSPEGQIAEGVKAHPFQVRPCYSGTMGWTGKPTGISKQFGCVDYRPRQWRAARAIRWTGFGMGLTRTGVV